MSLIRTMAEQDWPSVTNLVWIVLSVLPGPLIVISFWAWGHFNVKNERRRLVRQTTPFLEPGEHIQSVFAANVRVVAPLGMLNYLDPYIIAATDRAFIVLHMNWRRITPPAKMPMRHPRNQHLGQPVRSVDSPIYPKFYLSGQKFEVSKRFLPDIAAADAALERMQSGQ